MSGEILMQFTLIDTANPLAPPSETYQKFKNLVCTGEEEDDLVQIASNDLDDGDEDRETSDETDDPTKPEVVEKRRRRLRLKRLKRKSLAARAYQFSGASNGVQGIVFMEVIKVSDLPPERNGMINPIQLWRRHANHDSNTHLIRHGPVCGDFSWEKDTQDAGR